MAENPIMTSVRFLLGARWISFASIAVAACGGGDGGGGGGGEGDDDAGSAGDAGEGATSGSSGSDSGGTENGGSGGDSGGTISGGGSGGKGGTAGTGTGATGPALDRIEEACEVDCDAQFALECAPANQNTLTCKANCAAQTGQLGDFCLTEYAELVECRGEGGYACVTTYPYPNSTCAAQQLAFSMCLQNIGCKRSCDKSVDEGCTSMSLDECIDACIAEGATLPENCSYTWDGIAACKLQADAACVDGELETPMTCAPNVMRVAECIYDDATEPDMCEAWCWAADTLSCGGTDCMAECARREADATCGMAWTEVMDCGLFFGDAGCADGYLAANSICDSEMTTYTTCVQGGM
jgi:hypothetical protein